MIIWLFLIISELVFRLLNSWTGLLTFIVETIPCFSECKNLSAEKISPTVNSSLMFVYFLEANNHAPGLIVVENPFQRLMDIWHRNRISASSTNEKSNVVREIRQNVSSSLNQTLKRLSSEFGLDFSFIKNLYREQQEQQKFGAIIDGIRMEIVEQFKQRYVRVLAILATILMILGILIGIVRHFQSRLSSFSSRHYSSHLDRSTNKYMPFRVNAFN